MIDPSMHAQCALRCLLLCGALLLGACDASQGRDDAATQASAGQRTAVVDLDGAADPRSAGPSSSAAAAPGASVDAQDLHRRAERAMAERRLLDPAGDNALEYYLALRDAAPGDIATDNALSELQPYALITTEQALAGGDVLQARRMVALLARSDPTAPAMPRLHGELERMDERIAASGRAERDALAEAASSEAALAKATLATAALDQEQSALARAAQARIASAAVSGAAAMPSTATPAVATGSQPTTTAPPSAAQRAPAAGESRSSTPNNLPQVAEVVPASPVGSAQPIARPSASSTAAASPTVPGTAGIPASLATVAPLPRPSSARSALPRLVTDAIPRFPLIAINRGIAGSVVVAFTVLPDGSVSNPRVQSATPPGVFDNAALSAAARWRFAPSNDSHATTRTLAFPLQVQPGSKRSAAARPEAG